MSRFLFGAALGLLLAMPASAAIYRYTDANGNTVFTNRPPQDSGGEEVQLQSPNLIPPPAQRPPAEAEQAVEDEAAGYESITITGVPPVVRTEQLLVRVSLQPALHKGHRLGLKYDGKLLGEPGNSTSFTVPGIERGVHHLQAVVEDDEGVVASSEVVEFSRLQPGLNSPGR